MADKTAVADLQKVATSESVYVNEFLRKISRFRTDLCIFTNCHSFLNYLLPNFNVLIWGLGWAFFADIDFKNMAIGSFNAKLSEKSIGTHFRAVGLMT